MKPQIWRSKDDSNKYLTIRYQGKPGEYLEYNIQISKDNPNMGNIYLSSSIETSDRYSYTIMLSRHHVWRKNWKTTMAELTGIAMFCDLRKDMAKFMYEIGKAEQ